MTRAREGLPLLPHPQQLRVSGGRTHRSTLDHPQRTIDPSAVKPPQGFEICISAEGARLIAHDEAGLFYAEHALQQIKAHAHADGSVACCQINDWPDLPVRGFMLDVSRGRVPTMAFAKALIDQLAALRINQLQLYTEHTFAYAGHETVWAQASPLTPIEIQALDDYCAQRHIELVPNQNTFGHMTRWLIHDEYKHLAECPDGFQHPLTGRFTPQPFTLNPTDPGTKALLADLLEQLLPNFRSRQVNIGCDETFDLGQGQSRSVCEQQGKASIYLKHLNMVAQLAGSLGRSVQFWGDIILSTPDRIPELPANATALNWGYEADEVTDESCRRFQAAGVPYDVCPGTSTWCSFAGRWANATANLKRSIQTGMRYGARGCLITDWGDQGHLQPPDAARLPLAYGASIAWNDSGNESVQAFMARARALLNIDAEAWRDLADSDRLTPPAPKNRTTAFNLFMFPEEPIRSPRFEGLTRAGIESGLQVTEPLAHHPDPQLAQAAALITLGLKLGEARLQSPSLDVGDLPVKTRSELRARLEHCTQSHQSLWHKTHRPGGLAWSTAYLNRLDRFLAGERPERIID